MAYQDRISEARRTARQAVEQISAADRLVLVGKFATAAGKYERAAGDLRRAAQAVRDGLVEREAEREDSGEVITPHRSPYPDPLADDPRYKELAAKEQIDLVRERSKGSPNDSLRMAADELEDEETFGAGPSD